MSNELGGAIGNALTAGYGAFRSEQGRRDVLKEQEARREHERNLENVKQIIERMHIDADTAGKQLDNTDKLGQIEATKKAQFEGWMAQQKATRDQRAQDSADFENDPATQTLSPQTRQRFLLKKKYGEDVWPTEKPIEVPQGGALYDPETKQPLFTNPGKPSAEDDDRRYMTVTANHQLNQPVTPEDDAFAKAYEKKKTLVGTTNFNLHQSGGDNSLVKVTHKDENGNTVVEYLPKGEVRGQTFDAPTNATTQNRVASAKAVSQTGNDIIKKLSDPQYAQTLGPVMGRAGSLSDFIGNPPPEYSELAGMIESYALANMGVHGMRSSQGAEKIKGLLDAKHTPASLAAAIRGLNQFSSHFMENEGARKGAPSTSAAGSPAAGSTQSGPPVGTVRTYNGETRQWTGTEWVKQ